MINKIQQTASSYLAGKISYFDGTHYAVSSVGFKPIAQSRTICVIARNQCIESKKTYSSISRKELQAILTLEKKAASQPTSYRIIENAKHDTFEVHKTVFSVAPEALKGAWILLPESIVLGTLYPKQLLSIHTPSGTLYAYMSDSLHCLYQAGLIRSLATFKHSVGLPDEAAGREITQTQYAELISQLSVNKSLLELLRSAVIYTDEKVNVNKLHALYIAPLATLTLVLGIMVGVQFYQLQKNEALANSASDEIKAILTTANEVSRINASLTEVNQAVLSTPLTYEHWQLLALLIEEQVKFNFVRYENKTLVVDGSVANSGQMLSKLNQHPLVHSAQFAGSVSKRGGIDTFDLNITLK